MAEDATTDDGMMDPATEPMADQSAAATAVADPAADPAAAATGEDPEKDQVRLLLNSTETLSPSERQYWLDLLPTMNPEQLEQLKEILQTEQEKLEAIDQKYDEKMEEVAEKTLNKWDSEKAKAERIKRIEEEKGHLEEDHETADALLDSW